MSAKVIDVDVACNEGNLKEPHTGLRKRAQEKAIKSKQITYHAMFESVFNNINRVFPITDLHLLVPLLQSKACSDKRSILFFGCTIF